MADISNSNTKIYKKMFIDMLMRYWDWRNKTGKEPNMVYTKPNQQGDFVNLARFNDMRARYEEWEGRTGSPPNYVYVIKPADVVTPDVPDSLKIYLEETKNCQVNDSVVQSVASKLNDVNAVFAYVLGLVYEYYYNTKRGAVKTMQDGSGNCCDLAHVIVALCRAKGIPARYVHNDKVKFSTITCGHVWAEIYVNGAWIRADASNNINKLGVNPYDNMLLGTTKRYKELPF